MKHDSLEYQPNNSEISVYECEIHLKFRLIEEKGALVNREELLERLIDAFTCGADDFLEPIKVCARAQEISELEASPDMRRQLIRLRNSHE